MISNTSPLQKNLMLIVLTIYYIETFVGRQIMAVMIEPIKFEFTASDMQMGLLTGLVFAIVFSLTGIFAGRLADKFDRTKLLAVSVLFWGIFTALCGYVNGFIMLLLMRMMIAVAEAPVASSSIALLADSYPLEQRSFAISCFTAGSTIAAIIALTIGAKWVEAYGWRTTFYIISAPTSIITLLFIFVIKDPRHIKAFSSQQNTNSKTESKTSFIAATKMLWQLKEYRLLVYASSFATVGANAFGMWNATFLVRSYGFTLTQAGLMAGLFGGVAAAVGILLSGYLADRISRKKGILWLPLMGHSLGWISMITYLTWPNELGSGFLGNNVPFAMLFCLSSSFFSVWWFSPSITLLTETVPNNQRALALALQTVFITLLGVGFGPILVGFLSDIYSHSFGTESLRYALFSISFSTLIAMYFLLRLKTLHDKKSNT